MKKLNQQTLSTTLFSCFQDLTIQLSDNEKKDLFKNHLQIVTAKTYNSYKYPNMNIQIIKK